jgi:hypothetical protein
LLACLGALSPSPSGAQEIHWQRTQEGCNQQRTTLNLTCGPLGDYSFATSAERLQVSGALRRGDGCQVEADGVETPRRIDKTGTSSEEAPGSGTRAARGSGGDKLHMIDWSAGNHGAWTSVIFSQGINYLGWHAYFLDISLLGVALEVPEASDLHLLESLCETIETSPLPPVLNMGFGRLLQEEPCASNSLTCEISHALDYLHDQDVILIAAAGNHDELLFPASHDDVIAVGMLDTRQYWPLGTVAPSPHTPPQANALIPGHGLMVFGPTGSGIPETIPFSAPPGSSNAAAFLSGWIAEVDWDYPGALDALRHGDAKQPLSIFPGSDGFYLQIGTDVIEESRIDRIDRVLEATFGIDQSTFEIAEYPNLYPLTIADQPSEIELPSSRPRLLTETNHPTPDSEPCVPCRLGARRRGRALDTQFRAGAGIIEVELEVGSAAMAADGVLNDLLLEVGGQFYALSGANYATVLADIQAGNDLVLELELPESLIEDQSLSLIVMMTRTTDGMALWDAIPLTIHLDVKDRIFSTTFETADISPWS